MSLKEKKGEEIVPFAFDKYDSDWRYSVICTIIINCYTKK